MQLIKSIIYIITSAVLCYLLWLFFHFITPYIMALNWIIFILVFLISGGLLIPIIGMLPGLLSVFINRLKSNGIIDSAIVVLLVLFFAFSASREAWIGWDNIGFKAVLYSIAQNILVLGVYWGIALTLVTPKES